MKSLSRVISLNLLSFLLITFCPVLHAESSEQLATANIRFNITGATQSQHYLCFPEVGCFNIQAGNAGKIYRLLHPVSLDYIYIHDNKQGQTVGLNPTHSCQGDVKINQSVTISGVVTVGKNNKLVIKNLQCHITKMSP